MGELQPLLAGFGFGQHEFVVRVARKRAAAGHAVHRVIFDDEYVYFRLGHNPSLLLLNNEQSSRSAPMLGHFADSPIGVDGTHDFDELPVIHRFGHIAGHAQIETIHLVLLLLGRGQHHHWHAF